MVPFVTVSMVALVNAKDPYSPFGLWALTVIASIKQPIAVIAFLKFILRLYTIRSVMVKHIVKGLLGVLQTVLNVIGVSVCRGRFLEGKVRVDINSHIVGIFFAIKSDDAINNCDHRNGVR